MGCVCAHRCLTDVGGLLVGMSHSFSMTNFDWRACRKPFWTGVTMLKGGRSMMKCFGVIYLLVFGFLNCVAFSWLVELSSFSWCETWHQPYLSCDCSVYSHGFSALADRSYCFAFYLIISRFATATTSSVMSLFSFAGCPCSLFYTLLVYRFPR